MSPTQRSLKYLRQQGWHCEIVEKYNHFTRTRHDLFGIADVICISQANPPLLVQVTSSNWSSRVRKIIESPLTPLVLSAGFQIEVHGWRKLKSNRNKMTIKVISITEQDLS